MKPQPTRYCDICVTKPAAKDDNLCEDCRRELQALDDNKWRWAGFDKSTDNHRKGYKGGRP